MTETTRQLQSTLSAAVATGNAVVLMAFELGAKTWKVALTADFGQTVRRRTVNAGDVDEVVAWVATIRRRLQVPAEARVVACYEAGRDGFWVHRAFEARGVCTLVIDAASIEVPRRQRHAKTDRLDAQRLVLLLVRWVRGERRAIRVVQVPTVAAEDARELHRELESVKRARGAVSNRIVGLLAKQGITVSTVTPTFGQRLARLRDWTGNVLPPGVLGRITRDWQEYEALTTRIARLEAERRRQITAGETPEAQQVRQLLLLRAIGENSAWLFVHEFFGWRQFRNRRQVGGLSGLTGTPYNSGEQERELGISRAGNRRVRSMVVEIAWIWVQRQPDSALTRWYQRRYAHGTRRQRRVGIVAVARKLLIELWRYLDTGALPEGALLKVATAAA